MSHNLYFSVLVTFVPIGVWDTVMLVMVLVGSYCLCFSVLAIVLDCCITSLKVIITMDVSSFLKLGMSLFSEDAQSDRSYATQNHHFKVMYGVHPTFCAIVWGELKQSMFVKDAYKPKHLLCVPIFLKTYTTESSLEVAIGVDEKTL